ncbi:SusE domain-containing protein [Psychroserpens algicola]|uniref:SusE domain-containing protein n=1 Tax=Psychroserpens algicola TaxID=1719034 RepID=A0ABT0H4R0_9FLAO|nr:SusE domain-containing protein [Psychroserpens algicola]MCK8479361.1 SusE domain-containing protein [Psychroserpens algicola]
MKINKISAFILSLFLVLVACETEESIDITSPDASFTLLEPSISNINLNYNLPNNEAFTIVWNDQLTSGDSYMIELSPDALFESPTVIGSSTTDRFTMTVADFNSTVLGEGAAAFEPFTVFMRVTSGSEISNSVSFSVSSYSEAEPVITTPDSSFSLVLLETTPNDEAISVTWEDPDFGENSSVDVIYEVQFAEAGTDFASAVTETATDMSFSSTHELFNETVLNAGLAAEEAGSLDIRVKATIEMDAGNMERFSEAVTITVTPYSVELAPILYVVGAGAADAGWSWDTPVELPLQGTKYSGNINLVNDAFRFFTVNNDWGSGLNYPYYESVGYTIDSNLANAMDGDSNFQFVGTPGEYFIEIDTDAKTITLGPPVVGPNCNFDQLWLVGAGIVDAGWSWDTPVALPCTGNGTYSGNVALTNDAFRFFSVNNDWGTGTNYPTYEGNGYTIDSNFNNAMDGDSNFFFNGTPGTYFLTVDDINKTITLGPEQLQCDFEQLWLVGAGVVDAGWSWDTPVALPCTGAGVYSGSVALTNDAFRFFTVNNDWGTGINYPTYEADGYTIDSDLINAMDGDSNFFFNGTPGTYTVTVDTGNLTITVE